MSEKKIEDLLRRLVAMSPEPPPYPEEIQVTNRNERRPSPMLVFAGAVAAVAALAIPLLLVFRGGPPDAVGSTTTTQSVSTTSQAVDTTVPGPTSTTTPSTSTTVPAASVWSGTVFLHQTPENSFLGNPALVPIRLEVTDPTGSVNEGTPFTEILGLLGDAVPFENSIGSDVRLNGVSVGSDAEGNDVLVADMNAAFLRGSGGLLADVTMLNQLVYTLTHETAFDSVIFTVGGEPIDAYGSEGIDLTDPVTRTTYIDELAVIFLTDPIMEVEEVYTIFGMANTFEASLSVRVLDGDGEADEIVHEEFTTATCGSGCWGEFGVGVDSDLIQPGTSAIQVLDYSAEDGSPQDIVTIPIPEDNVWRITLQG